GMLASSLDFLLEKDDEEPYPWAVSLNDFQTFLGAFKRKAWGPEQFCQFLIERSQLHGRVFNDDEMEFCGYFYLHGSLRDLNRADDILVLLTPGCASVFDELYAEFHRGRPAEVEAKSPPHIEAFSNQVRVSRQTTAPFTNLPSVPLAIEKPM